MLLRITPTSEKGFQRRRHELGVAARRQGAPSPRPATERRTGTHGPLQDRAVYNCHCGCVFEANVSTTVDCPHCGHGQAW